MFFLNPHKKGNFVKDKLINYNVEGAMGSFYQLLCVFVLTITNQIYIQTSIH